MDKKKEKKNIKDFIPAVLVSLAASFMLMVFAPIEIYYSNQDQFWFEIKQLIPVVVMPFCAFIYCESYYIRYNVFNKYKGL